MVTVVGPADAPEIGHPARHGHIPRIAPAMEDLLIEIRRRFESAGMVHARIRPVNRFSTNLLEIA